MLQTETINQSKALGVATLRHLKSVIKPRISTVQEAHFRILKLPDIASILVEVAYISNPREEGLLRRTDYQRKIAAAIASAIGDFLPAPRPVAAVGQGSAPSPHTVSTPPPLALKDPIVKSATKTAKTAKSAPQKAVKPEKKKTAATRASATSPKKAAQAKQSDSTKRIILYRVKRGDYLERIAKKNYTTVRSIMRLNKLKSKNMIRVGQKLKVYSPQLIHIVKRGDNLEMIAKRYKTSVTALMKINKIRSRNRIYINQKLKLPQSR